MRNNLYQMVATGAACLCCLVTAVLALPAAAGPNRWTAIGPDGTNVVALAIDPGTPSTVFAGTMGSGVLKSTDGGASWTTANGSLPTANVSALAIDPITPSTLFAGTDAGVFKSTDDGQSWAAANLGMGGASQPAVNALAIDTGSPATLYAATSDGVFRTNDGAANWTSINSGLSGLTPRLVAIDPTSRSTLYVAVDDYEEYIGFGVFKSTDAGTSWARIYTTAVGEDGGYSVAAIAIDPLSPSRLYLAVWSAGLLTSLDGGASWDPLNVPQTTWPQTAYTYTSLVIDPASSATLYAGTDSGVLFRTTDAGDHWTAVMNRPLAGRIINVVAVAPSAPETLYAGGTTGVARSSDGGETWTRLTLGVRNVVTYAIAVDPAVSSTIYGVVGGTVTKTTDGGAHWVGSNLGAPYQWVNSLVIDPVSPSTLYAGGNPQLYKSIDAGAHWAPASNRFAFGVGQALAIAPSRTSTLYAGATYGLVKSVDGGATWTQVNNGLAAAWVYTSALAVDPTNADIVYVATPPNGRPDTNAKIFKSTNGAAQWRQVPIALPTGTQVTSLAIDPATPSTIYATHAHGGYPGIGGGVFKSSDSGETWTPAQSGLPTAAFVLALAIDPGAPSQLYAATQGGVYRSNDGATTWTPFNAGLPTLDVSDISIDGTGTLLRATTGVGLFEYEISEQGNHTGLWWASPPGSESGWGINFADQGGIVFATWFTYGFDGKPLWLAAELHRMPSGEFAGDVFTTTGPPFDAVPFDPSRIVETVVGTMTVSFADVRTGTLAYKVYGIAQSKAIVRTEYASPVPTCVWGAQQSLALATNYQDSWWAAPASSESGWGIDLAHQGEIIFAPWFTYGADGKPFWLIVLAQRTVGNVFSGPIWTLTGPPFNAVPFDRAMVKDTVVGTGTFTFADGNDATFAYTVNDISQTKPITRQVFAAPGTVCQ